MPVQVVVRAVHDTHAKFLGDVTFDRNPLRDRRDQGVVAFHPESTTATRTPRPVRSP